MYSSVTTRQKKILQHLYQGPYSVVSRIYKPLTGEVVGRITTMSIDRLKLAYAAGGPTTESLPKNAHYQIRHSKN